MANGSAGGRILIVDDEPMVASFLERCFHDRPYAVDVAHDVASAVACIARHPHDIAVIDKNMPGSEHPNEGGLEVLKAVRERSPGCEAIIITGYPDAGSAIAALRAGACDYLVKPFTPDRIKSRVDEIMNRRGLLDRDALGPALHTLRSALLQDAVDEAARDPAERVKRYEDLRAAYRRVVDGLAYRDRRLVAGMETFGRLSGVVEELAELVSGNGRAAELVEKMRALVAEDPFRGKG